MNRSMRRAAAKKQNQKDKHKKVSVGIDPLTLLHYSSTYSPEEVSGDQIRFQLALNSLLSGSVDKQSFSDLVVAYTSCNLILLNIKQYEAVEYTQKAIKALASIKKRNERFSIWEVLEPEEKALLEGSDVVHQTLLNCSPLQMQKALAGIYTLRAKFGI